MTEFVLIGDRLLRSSSARIARGDIADFRESVHLLEQAKHVSDRAFADAQEAREEGYREGREQALAEMRDVLADCISRLQQDIAQEDSRRERAASIAAIQAVEQLIGARDEADVVTGLVREAMQRSGATPLRIRVAPEWVETVQAELPVSTRDCVLGDESLTPMGCRIEVEDGRIVADLEQQLDALRSRWGMMSENPDG